MPTITITFHQVTISLLIGAAIFGILGLATSDWYSGYSVWSLGRSGSAIATQAFVVMGVAGVCLALLMEILMLVSVTFKASRAVHILTLIFVIVGFVGLLIGDVISGTNFCSAACGFSYWFVVIGTVLMFEAVFFYVIAWRC